MAGAGDGVRSHLEQVRNGHGALRNQVIGILGAHGSYEGVHGGYGRDVASSGAAQPGPLEHVRGNGNAVVGKGGLVQLVAPVDVAGVEHNGVTGTDLDQVAVQLQGPRTPQHATKHVEVVGMGDERLDKPPVAALFSSKERQRGNRAAGSRIEGCKLRDVHDRQERLLLGR